MYKDAIIRSLLIVAVAGTAVFAASQGKEVDALPDGPGRKILDNSCTVCHKLIEVTKFKGYYSKENWRDIVATMIADGARVEKAQIPVLVDYLTKTFPKEFPDGPEKKLLESACSGCHPVTDIRKLDGYLTRADWEDVIRVMAAKKGAKIGEDQVPILADYLAETFPPLKRPTSEQR
jgi:cytochrome c5